MKSIGKLIKSFKFYKIDSFRVNEEKTRKERLEQVAKEYEELAEREKRILDQINFSLQLSPKPSETR